VVGEAREDPRRAACADPEVEQVAAHEVRLILEQRDRLLVVEALLRLTARQERRAVEGRVEGVLRVHQSALKDGG